MKEKFIVRDLIGPKGVYSTHSPVSRTAHVLVFTTAHIHVTIIRFSYLTYVGHYESTCTLVDHMSCNLASLSFF